MVRGDQRVARECYSASMKQKAVDNIYVDELDMRDEVNTRPERRGKHPTYALGRARACAVGR